MIIPFLDPQSRTLQKPIGCLSFYPTIVYDSLMSAPSATSYTPFDSYAPAVFSGTQTNNYLKGDWCLSYLIIPTLSHLYLPVAFLVQRYFNAKLLKLTCGHLLD